MVNADDPCYPVNNRLITRMSIALQYSDPDDLVEFLVKDEGMDPEHAWLAVGAAQVYNKLG